MTNLAPLKNEIAIAQLRQKAIDEAKPELVNLCDRALAGQVLAKSQCLRLIYP